MTTRKWYEPSAVFEEYEKGKQYKTSLGTRGLFKQGKMNERFFVGDQWRGAQTGADKPLVRYNIVKRIGEYKMSVIGAADVAVSYSAEGVPNTQGIKEKVRAQMDTLRDASENGLPPEEVSMQGGSAEQINLIMAAMSDYFKTTAERVKFGDLKNLVLRKAYISGTGVLYTYWDERVKTGLYADLQHTSPIMGDIRCEVLDIENVYFGDPSLDDVQEQPYIILAQRKSVAELKRMARRNNRPAHEIDAIKPDEEKGYMAGDRADEEQESAQKATVLTKLYKSWDEKGLTYCIKAVEVVKGAIIRRPWDIGIRLYPITKYSWEERANCVYGESEITYLVPNQIAINRAITAEVWSAMITGMPIMLVNGDVVTSPVTNEPGQIVTVFGSAQNIANAIKFITPPNAVGQFDNLVNSIVANTLSNSGANDAALGEMRPDNTSAILAVREAATMPLQLLKNRFHSFVEDVARLWAEMWVSLYGARQLKIEDEKGEWYLPFNGEDYRDLMISARVDVGDAGLWSEIQARQTLDNMLINKLITPQQYLERLPKGSVPDLGGLIRDLKTQTAPPPPPAGENGGNNETVPPTSPMPDFNAIAQQLPPKYAEAFSQLSDAEKQQVMARVMGGAQN